MRRRMLTSGLLGAWCVVMLAAASARGEGPAAAPSGPPPAAPVPESSLYPGVPAAPPAWFADAMSCKTWPFCNSYSSLLAPLELYARLGPAFLVGGGRFDQALETGVSLQVGGRSFWFDDPCGGPSRGAWTADLGIDYEYNNSDDGEPAITRRGGITVTRGFGSQDVLPVTSHYSIIELHRINLHLAGGHEWYWGGEGPGATLYQAGFDVGLRLGHAHLKRRLLSATIPGFDPDQGDTADIPEEPLTQFTQGLFVAVHGELLMPCTGFDYLLGLRIELGRDWIDDLVDNDKTLDHVSFLATTGIRF